MTVTVVTNAGQVAADFRVESEAVKLRVHKVVVTFGAILQGNIKRRAALPRTGPPGPRLITGSYNRSINRTTLRQPGGSVAIVGTNAPQARRLEFGFVGVDSIGRRYNQPPYAHFGPGLDETGPGFLEAVGVAVTPVAGVL